MSNSFQLADTIIDEKPPQALLPNVRVPRNDLRILKKMLNVIACWTPANYGFTQSSKTMEFEVDTGNAENHNDSFCKLVFTVEGLSDGDHNLNEAIQKRIELLNEFYN